jgi:hypothetical protein
MIDVLLQDSELPAEANILLNSLRQAPDGLGDRRIIDSARAFGNSLLVSMVFRLASKSTMSLPQSPRRSAYSSHSSPLCLLTTWRMSSNCKGR